MQAGRQAHDLAGMRHVWCGSRLHHSSSSGSSSNAQHSPCCMPADQNYCVLPPKAGTKHRQRSYAAHCHRMQLPRIAAVLPCTAQPHSSQLPVSAAVLPMQHTATGAATRRCCSAPHAVRGHSSWLQGLLQCSYAARSRWTYLHCVSVALAAIAHVTTLAILPQTTLTPCHAAAHGSCASTFFGPCDTCRARPAVLDTGFITLVAAAAYLVQVRACCGLPCWVSCWDHVFMVMRHQQRKCPPLLPCVCACPD